ncbi:uncharacterized protein (DUF433 family) [Dyadobacter sp. BE34]|uniref:Uncharacterized protein (DUF433 family) n=1 Tax=Dyadobacter fermentans TaxID=94254 RepID=A0ABU1R2Y5_9BACT|nr:MULTISPECIES: DUF433 domain-containing protein [Dyadobacter]MDR6807713.1 uncharacterized protein (DUF433 family) [Dyadobacter fermentans]MDR7045454.1 uncharacterized protein (DUF433 family) [Dyadobacter sp. BE242]MDR7199767.1 uncharacterized protein (DUF433 family) [Dyadobacter sp. BE34]MDR7217774.1 uncharacterized protein (DUF433 family) [Dyadobacter sp. BE31]MDR7265658.1 uncharacterized protein (DUF433 family) [Dyadobacter sp. BE32]
MTYREFITSDHTIMLGKPVIKGTRLTVELILRKLGEGATHADLIRMYPDLSSEAIQAALQYAAEVIANEESLEAAR